MTKASIVKALMGKGYSKKSATSIAKATLKKQKFKVMTDWNKSIQAELDEAHRMRKQSEKLHRAAAINKPSTMAGKVVVVPPKRQA